MTMMHHRLKAFLVEDNPLIRDNLIPAMAELANVDVLGYSDNEADAVVWIEANSALVEVLILDMFLAQGTGLNVLKTIRKDGIDTCVVVLTNHATADMRRRCKEGGCDAFFDKAQENEEFFSYLRNNFDTGLAVAGCA